MALTGRHEASQNAARASRAADGSPPPATWTSARQRAPAVGHARHEVHSVFPIPSSRLLEEDAGDERPVEAGM